jgi:hypothetical protein
MPTVMTAAAVNAIVLVMSERHRPPTARSLREFWEAVRALSDDPSKRNVSSYLTASRALEPAPAVRRRRRVRA